ncbi:hypothetical protein Tco_0932201 [Tanacetum coccineum]
MVSLDYRLNPIYTIKECSPCGALYNKSCGCSKGGFGDKFVRDPNKTSDTSQRPPHNCLKCGNPVDGLYCRQCAILRKKLKEDPDENSSQSPPHIDHHCYFGRGDSLDDIFCQRCTCESYGNGAYYGYNCPPKVPIISNPEPCYNQNVDEFPQTLPSFHPTCYSGDENSFTYDSNLNFVDDSPNPPLQPPTYSYEFCGNDAYYGHDCEHQVSPSNIIREGILELFRKLHDDVQNIHEELAEYINTLNWNRPIVYYDDDDDEDYTIAITPVLSTNEPIDSLIMEDEHLDTIPATESDEVIKSSVEDLVPIPSESEGIPDNMCDVPFHDNSPPLDISKDQFEGFSDSNDDYTSIDDDSFSIAINRLYYEAFFCNSKPDSGNFTMDSFVIKSPIPVEDEKNSGSTTIYADISLPDLEYVYFKSEPDPGDLTSIIDPGIRENVSSTTNVNLPFEDDQSPLFAYVVWIFLSFLTYPVTPPYLLSFGNEDTIFDPGISIYHSFMPGVSHRSGTFMKFNVYPNHLNESPMEILSSTCSPMDQ